MVWCGMMPEVCKLSFFVKTKTNAKQRKLKTTVTWENVKWWLQRWKMQLQSGSQVLVIHAVLGQLMKYESVVMGRWHVMSQWDEQPSVQWRFYKEVVSHVHCSHDFTQVTTCDNLLGILKPNNLSMWLDSHVQDIMYCVGWCQTMI